MTKTAAANPRSTELRMPTILSFSRRVTSRVRLRNEHRHLFAIHDILRVFLYEVGFFESNGHQDVSGRHDSEQQMRNGHRRSAPESQQPADIQRVPDDPVEKRSDERNFVLLLTFDVPPNLAQTEQVEVVITNVVINTKAQPQA